MYVCLKSRNEHIIPRINYFVSLPVFVKLGDWPHRGLPSYFADHKETLLPNDRLTLHYTVGIFEMVKLEGPESRMLVPDSSLSDDLYGILISGDATDVILTCKGGEFKSHKIILASRSPVFAAMFTHEMKEKKHCRVEIVDMEKDVLKEMLTYMYTDKASDLEKMANGLLVAAGKVSCWNHLFLYLDLLEFPLKSMPWKDFESCANGHWLQNCPSKMLQIR